MTFDRNALSYGSDISHSPGSSTFTINKPGIYSVAFHGVLSATSKNTFPVTLVTSLKRNSTAVPETTIPYNFQNTNDASEQSFTVPVAVSTVPTTLQVSATGGNHLADAITLSIIRLGNIPS